MKSLYLPTVLLIASACGSTAEPGDDPGVDAGPSVTADAGTATADAAPGADAEPAAECGHDDSSLCSYAYEDGSLTYTTDRDEERVVAYRIWYPESFAGDAPVIIVSHGGSGSTQGHTKFQHLGTEYASRGFVAIHLNHRASTNEFLHRLDRPADATAIIDAVVDGSLSMPSGFEGDADIDRMGYIGHSWGAYTAHSVAGANFVVPAELGGQTLNFRHDRIKAFVALSPQGWDGFGAYDDEHDVSQPSSNNSWSVVTIPAFNIIGALEMNVRAGQFMGDQWRRFPFVRYPSDGTKHLSILPGQNHGDIGDNGPDQVKTFIAVNTRTFFEVYLRGQSAKASSIGHLETATGVETSSK
jgi:hypothetical protein